MSNIPEHVKAFAREAVESARRNGLGSFNVEVRKDHGNRDIETHPPVRIQWSQSRHGNPGQISFVMETRETIGELE